MKELENKVVIITGASSGIGISTAFCFAKLGAKLVLHDSTKELVDEAFNVSARYLSKSSVLKVIGDITNDAVRDKIVNDCLKKYNKIDILVNNAGISKPCTLISDFDLNDFDLVMNVNTRSVVALTQKCLPSLIQNKGSIINVSSVLSTIGVHGSLYYCMSKGALDQFTRCLALDLASKQVRVNSVNPAVLRQPIFQEIGLPEEKTTEDVKAIHPLGRIVEPEEVAQAIAYLASDRASFTTGQTLIIDGGCLINNAFWRTSFTP